MQSTKKNDLAALKTVDSTDAGCISTKRKLIALVLECRGFMLEGVSSIFVRISQSESALS